MEFKDFIKHAAKAASTVAHHAGAKNVPLLHKANTKIKKKLNEGTVMDFETFLTEGKIFAYSKDGVRKQVKDTVEAANWRDTIAKPAKAAPAKAAGPDLKKIANIVQHEVSNGYPDTDGYDFIHDKLKKMGINENNIADIVDKAVKAHLGAKDFHKYVDTFKD